METSVEENPWRLLEPVGDTTTMTTAEDHEESQVFKKIDPTKLNRLNLNGKTLNFHYFAGAARYFEKSVSSVTGAQWLGGDGGTVTQAPPSP